MTAPEWRDCADPDELAAAVAAGVEPRVTDQYGNTGPTCRRTASAFLDAIRDGFTYQLPTAWTWSPEPPAPPWPGAVLSGLTDEDGEPTWLAQAGNVQGESVRTCADFPWFVCGSDNASDRTWVEVRAPRAVPVPETERVPWWEAKDRLGLAGDRFVEVGADDEGPWVRVVEGGTKLHSPVEPDGTVKVLKDGDR